MCLCSTEDKDPQASPATAACCSTAHVTKEMVVDQLLGMIRSALAGCEGNFCNSYVPCDYTFTTVYASSIFQQHSICDTVAKCLHAFVVHRSKVFQELCKCVLRLSLFVHARVVFCMDPIEAMTFCSAVLLPSRTCHKYGGVAALPSVGQHNSILVGD